MAQNTKNPYTDFFQRLTRLFRSGPSIRRKVKGYDYRNFYDRQVSQANQYGWRGGVGSPVLRDVTGYGSFIGHNGMVDRFARYQEFIEAENVPEVAAALNLFADESVASDENGKCFHIYSDNPEVRASLEELFEDVLNIEYNLRYWVRNMVKYGDAFIWVDAVPDYGIVNAAPLPVSVVEREEGWDRKDPTAVRFKVIGGSARTLQNWQVMHFRMVGNDVYYPYGMSVLDPARKIIRMLSMAEDAMLTYRIARSAERRVFYIDTAGIPTNDVPTYMARAQAAFKSAVVTDKQTGRIDYRNNPLSLLEDFWIPTRGNNFTTKIETLAGGQHVSATEDVEYLQNKLFAALQVPKSYLGFNEETSSKASLAQLDVRFSRTISVIQKVILAELNKIAMVHLYSAGFEGDDLVDFDLRLSNPSTLASQQKLELWAAKFNIAGTAKEVQIVDEEWIQKNVLGLTNDEISRTLNGRRKDKAFMSELESITPPQEPPSAPEPSMTDPFHPSTYLPPGGLPKPEDGSSPGEEPTQPETSTIPTSDSKEPPIKPSGFLARNKKNTSRQVGYSGAYALSQPDFSAMLSPSKNRRLGDINDQEWLKSRWKTEAAALREMEAELFPDPPPGGTKLTRIPGEVKTLMKRFAEHHSGWKPGRKTILVEVEDMGSNPLLSSGNTILSESENLQDVEVEELLEEPTTDLKSLLISEGVGDSPVLDPDE